MGLAWVNICAYKGGMGIRSRMTRDSLAKVEDGEFEAFLDDVTEVGFRAACESRLWTQGAVLNWLRGSEVRWAAYDGALKAKSEVMAHETIDIADASEDAKLQVDTRLKVAGKWHRDRYGERVQVDKSVTVGVDAGLVGFAGALLARLGRREEKLVAQEEPEAVLVEADAPETARVPDLTGRVSSAGVLPPNGSPGQSVSLGPI